MKPRDARAATTSILRAETLSAEGYRFKRVRPGVVEVKGKPTTHKRRDSSTRIDPHGPYVVDTISETCPCPAFGYRGVCPHILPAQEFEAALLRGESMEVRATRIDSDMIVLREIGGERLLCRDDRTSAQATVSRVIVFRNYETAASYWVGEGLIEVCEISTADVAQLQDSDLYAGMHLLTDRQEAPIDFGAKRTSGGPTSDRGEFATAPNIGLSGKHDPWGLVIPAEQAGSATPFRFAERPRRSREELARLAEVEF